MSIQQAVKDVHTFLAILFRCSIAGWYGLSGRVLVTYSVGYYCF